MIIAYISQIKTAGEFHTMCLPYCEIAKQHFPAVRTFRVVACIMYSKNLTDDSETLCDQDLNLSLLTVFQQILRTNYLLTRFIKKDWEEYAAHLDTSPRYKSGAFDRWKWGQYIIFLK